MTADGNVPWVGSHGEPGVSPFSFGAGEGGRRVCGRGSLAPPFTLATQGSQDRPCSSGWLWGPLLSGHWPPEGCWECGPFLMRGPELHADLEAGAQALVSTCDPLGSSGPSKSCLSHSWKTRAPDDLSNSPSYSRTFRVCPSSPKSTTSMGPRGCKDWSQRGGPPASSHALPPSPLPSKSRPRSWQPPTL